MWKVKIEFANFFRPKFLIGINVWEWYSDAIECGCEECIKEPTQIEGQTLEIGFFLFSICIIKITDIGT